MKQEANQKMYARACDAETASAALARNL